MTPDMTIWIGAAATILAAFIAGTVALTSTVIAKEQKVAEFRQAWINEFRNDVAIALKHAYRCCYLKQSLPKPSLEEAELDNLEIRHREQISDALSEFELKVILIKLKLNPVKDKAFIAQADTTLDLVGKINPYAKKDKIKEQYIKAKESLSTLERESHSILKSQWERVKQGELLSRFFISTGKVLIGSSITAFVFYVLYSGFPRYCPVVG